MTRRAGDSRLSCRPIRGTILSASRVLSALHELLGSRGLLPAEAVEERYRVDVLGQRGEAPLSVMRPADTPQLSAALALCHAAGVPVVTQGGRTGLAQGQLPQAGEIVLSTERMTAIEEIDADAATATVQAGVPLQRLQERVEPDGLMFPLDLGARGSCTLGGNIATNAGGNRVLRYGMTRELVLGLEVVLADGSVLDGCKPLLKNNTGPDLKQLFIGSEGTLGVVTRAVLRLFPLPADRAVALCAVEDFECVKALLRHVRGVLAGELTSFEVMWDSYYRRAVPLLGRPAPIAPGRAFHVLIEASGADPALLAAGVERMLAGAIEQQIVADAVLAKSGAEIAELWRVRDLAIEASRQLDPIVPFDISVPIARMGRFVTEMQAATRAVDARCDVLVFGHLADGNLHVAVHAPPDRPDSFHAIERAVYGLVGRHGGAVSPEHGIGWLKRAYLGHSRSPAEIAVMRQLKAALDPRNILNPGRILR
jgi:FAD/FMN-containing dehydrogenase